jgi:DNA-binding NarL/FixJ family response regulator
MMHALWQLPWSLLASRLRTTESSDLKLLEGRAWTAQEAIVQAADLKPRVVVFDLLMPQGACSTFDAIRVISRKSVVLVYSALEDAQVAATAIRAGALGFLTKGGKGADLERIADMIRSVASKQLAIDPTLEGRVQQILAAKEPARLTIRETAVLICLKRGMHDEDIARELGMSVATVRAHLRNAMRKQGVHSRLDLVLRVGERIIAGPSTQNGASLSEGLGDGGEGS